MKKLSIKEKDLLLKDLCARLPYNVVAQYSEKIPQWYNEKYGFEFEKGNIVCFKINYDNISYVREKIDYFKPYLRSMSSMTDEEKDKINILLDIIESSSNVTDETGRIIDCSYDCIELIDFYNSRYLDYHGLIPMGLALEAPEDMYKIK